MSGTDHSCQGCLKFVFTWLSLLQLVPPRNKKSLGKNSCSCYSKAKSIADPKTEVLSLCFANPCKIQKNIIINRVEPIIDPPLSAEQNQVGAEDHL